MQFYLLENFADFKGIDALLEAAKIYEEEAEEKNKKQKQ